MLQAASTGFARRIGIRYQIAIFRAVSNFAPQIILRCEQFRAASNFNCMISPLLNGNACQRGSTPFAVMVAEASGVLRNWITAFAACAFCVFAEIAAAKLM